MGDQDSDVMSDYYSISKFNTGKRGKNIITLSTGLNQHNYSQSKFGESGNKSEISLGNDNKRRKYMEDGEYEQQNFNGK